MRYVAWVLALAVLPGCSGEERDSGGSSGTSSGNGSSGSDGGSTSDGGTTVATGMSSSGTGGVDCSGDEPPPGCPGGFCLAPTAGQDAPWCHDGVCDLDGAFCYDPADPCRGFGCGGAERGTCEPMDGLPACVCADGYNNDMFALFCCPDEGACG